MRTRMQAAVATGVALMAVAAQAGTAQAQSAAAAQVLTFNKGGGPTTGTLVFVAGTTEGKWRAGSGNGSQWSNDCAVNRGHLPNGTYQTTWHNNYSGNVIKGRAVYLGNKLCSAGTATRTELFIHSEQTVNNTQSSTIESQRWDGDEDYKSEGCVKLHPNDIAALFKLSASEPGQADAILRVVS